jgi:hypothetical protein
MFEKDTPANLIPHDTRFWGDNYFLYQKIEQDASFTGKRGKCLRFNYFISEIAGICRYALPFIKNIGRFMGDKD